MNLSEQTLPDLEIKLFHFLRAEKVAGNGMSLRLANNINILKHSIFIKSTDSFKSSVDNFLSKIA